MRTTLRGCLESREKELLGEMKRKNKKVCISKIWGKIVIKKFQINFLFKRVNKGSLLCRGTIPVILFSGPWNPAGAGSRLMIPIGPPPVRAPQSKEHLTDKRTQTHFYSFIYGLRKGGPSLFGGRLKISGATSLRPGNRLREAEVPRRQHSPVRESTAWTSDSCYCLKCPRGWMSQGEKNSTLEMLHNP